MGKVCIEAMLLHLKIDDFEDEIVRMLDVLECDMWIDWSGTFEEGFHSILVFIAADALEIVSLFLQTIQRAMSVSDWKISQEPIHLRSIREWMSSRSIRADGTPVWRLVLEHQLELSRDHNQRVQEGLPFWIVLGWEAKPFEMTNLNFALGIAEANQISIHYVYTDPPLIGFYFKIRLYTAFDTHLNRIKELLSFDKWEFLKPIEYDSQYPFNVAKIETYPRLIRETIPAFLEAIKPHL